MVANTIFQAHVTYVTLKLALNIQVNVSNKPCLYLLYAGTGLCTSLTRFTYF